MTGVWGGDELRRYRRRVQGASACWLAESGKPLPAVERRMGAASVAVSSVPPSA